MKYLPILLLFFFCCASNSETNSTEKESLTNQLPNKANSEDVDIEMIKTCGIEGITDFDLEFITFPEVILDSNFVNETLGKFSFNEEEALFLKASEWEPFACYQWEENEDYFLFTLLNRNEYCCQLMYLCLTDKKGKVLAINEFGLYGGDSGWSGNNRGKRIDFGKYHLFHQSTMDEDQFDGDTYLGYSREEKKTEIMLSIQNSRFIRETISYTKTDTLIGPTSP